MDDNPVITAHHEAGHMLMYRLHNLRFRYATIRPRQPDVLGCVKPWRSRLIGAWEHAEVAWGGLHGEAQYGYRHDDDGFDLADYEAGAGLINVDGDGAIVDNSVYRVPTQETARIQIEAYWPLVEWYAAELLAHSTVTGKRVWQLADEFGLPPGPMRRRCH